MRRVLLFVIALALALPASAQATEIGLNVSGGETPDQLANVKATGVTYSRSFLTWDALEPAAKGRYDPAWLTGFDRMVADLAASGIKPIFVFTNAPQWASGSADGHTPPRSVADYADTLGMLARRWAGRVGAWEIWNEPDEPAFWTGAPQPDRYAALLKAGYAAVKAADPAATVLAGPTTGNNYLWIEQLLDRGIAGSFDGVSVHTDTACLVNPPTTFFREPDGRLGRFSFLGYRSVRQSLLARGIDVPIWMTELGWSATTSPCTFGAGAGNRASGVSEEQQAKNLTQAFACLKKDSYVKAALWFVDRDRQKSANPEDNYGLKRADGSQRPSYAAFEDVARGRANLNAACGDFDGPQLTVVSPTPGQQFDQSLPIFARSSASDIRRIQFSLKSPAKAIKSVSAGIAPNRTVGLTWQRARSLKPGNYTVVVTAYRTGGNTTVTEVPVTRIDPSKLPAQKTKIAKPKVRGRGSLKTILAELQSKVAGLPGRIVVQFQRRKGKRWVRAFHVRQSASRPIRIKRRLRPKGSWRVRVVYNGKKPYKRSVSQWKRFRVG